MRIPDDREGLERTFEELYPIARGEARKVFYAAPSRPLYEFDDLEQEAEIALWELLNRYKGRDNINALYLGKAVGSKVWRFVHRQELLSGGNNWYESGREAPQMERVSYEEVEEFLVGQVESYNGIHVEEILNTAQQVCNEMEYAALTGSCLHDMTFEAIGKSMGGKSRQYMEQCYRSAVKKIRARHDQ